MHRIIVSLGELSYPIVIGRGLLESLGAELRAAGVVGALALVQDATVAPLYGERVLRSLRDAGYPVTVIDVPSGEGSKSLEQLGELYAALASGGLDRGSAVVALGGGVVGDLAGFAAATYLRGIPFVQVPTTLLAQVDASVGGKTAIDLPAGKNLVGAFHQPRLVLIDLETLQTLPEADFRSGLAEVLKYGVIADAGLFEYLEVNRAAVLGHQLDALEHIVTRSCQIKADVVGADERESGLRAILNYGHTIGHAVEAVAGFGEYLHGEAVALGMHAAGYLSHRVGWLDAEDMARIDRLIVAYGLPTRLCGALSEDLLVDAMRRDKKTRGGEFRFVLARGIGQVEVSPLSEELAREGVRRIQPGAPVEGVEATE